LARRALPVALAATVAACGSGGSRPARTTTEPSRPAPAPGTASSMPPGPVSAALLPWGLPAPVSRPVVLAHGSDLLVLGGLDAAGSSVATVACLHPGGGTAAAVASLAEPTHDAGGAVLGESAVVVGGGAATVYSSVQRLPLHGAGCGAGTGGGGGSGGSATASVAATLPRPRADLSVARSGGTAYVVGGYDGKALDPAVLATADGVHFEVVAHLADPVRYAAVAAAGPDVYVMGGEAHGQPVAAIQRVDPATGTTTVIGHLPVPLEGASAIVLRGRILVLGGEAGGRPSNGIVAVDPATGAATMAGHLPEAVAYAGAAVVGGAGYLVGGEGPAPLATVVRITGG
ncbi:MAG: hypothetical protein ACRDZQ_09455, partial [Acidimicrobiales bacterium]